MRQAITPELVELIRRLLALGWSQRLIARQTRASFATVSRIATGKWKPCPQTRPGIAVETLRCSESEEQALLELSATRCPGCGGRVYRWPCLLCEVRGIQSRRAA